MSKSTNDDLNRSGTGCFIALWEQWGVKGLIGTISTNAERKQRQSTTDDVGLLQRGNVHRLNLSHLVC